MRITAKSVTTLQAETKSLSGWLSRVSGKLEFALGLIAVLALIAGQPARCQTGAGASNSPNGPRPPFSAHQDTASSFDDIDPMIMARRMTALNVERQKQMVSDANKLLKLARELNDEVAAANSDSFTPDQLRKIAEIEKLARSVRERMASAVGAPQPTLLPPPAYVFPTH